MRKKKKAIVLTNVPVTDYAAEGKALARQEGKVIFVSGAIPGDTADLMLTKSKKDWAEARVLQITSPSPNRIEPFCMHFGVCGGCKWQMLPYELQLKYKEQEATQNLKRIGKLEHLNMLPAVGAHETRAYRNKLEFTFSNKEFLPDLNTELPENHPGALGYHVPRIFDKTISISECWLMHDVNNAIRNTMRRIATENGFEFYNIKEHTGWLRNLIVRYTTTGELMINLVVNHEDAEKINLIFEALKTAVPGITTFLYTINPKWNDSIYDLEPKTLFGPGFIHEKLGEFEFIISPKSFFQTNTHQAEKLYNVTKAFAGLTGKETVYDLYCGTGSIGIFVSKGAKKIIGVETVEDAVKDAKRNAERNGLSHAEFFAGDVINVCNDQFFETHGKPDVVITDPPRAGMHEKLVNKLLEMESPVIVYVSCNTATMARDIALLAEKYSVEKAQAVDMFPHTHHIECVARLILKPTQAPLTTYHS